MEATKKFSGKAAVYRKNRPSYPAELLGFLRRECGLSDGSRVADIGAGTGIFTAQLLTEGYRVTAVEPNGDMYAALREAFQALQAVRAPAEETGLPSAWFDLVTAAQSFHWFDAERFRRECRRILKPGGAAALIWNNRVEDSRLVIDNAAVCRAHCPAFHGFSGGGEQRAEQFDFFFGAGNYMVREIPNDLQYDLDGFIGRNLSSSYAPKEGEAEYAPFVKAITQLFESYAAGGVITVPNVTRCYLGSVK